MLLRGLHSSRRILIACGLKVLFFVAAILFIVVFVLFSGGGTSTIVVGSRNVLTLAGEHRFDSGKRLE